MDDKRFEEALRRAQEVRRSSMSERRLAKFKKARVIYADSIVIEGDKRRGQKNRFCPCPCGCFRLGQKSLEIGQEEPYVVCPPVSKRSDQSILFIHKTYERLMNYNSEIEKDWTFPIYCDLTDVFKHCRRGLRFLQLLMKFSEESLRSLSYYLEDKLPEEQVNLTESRSIIGSFTWLVIVCFQSIPDPRAILQRKDFRRLLREIVSLSEIDWVGMVAIIDAFIKVRFKTESTIIKYIQPLAENKCLNPNDPPTSTRTSLCTVRKNNLRLLKHYNKVGHHPLDLQQGPTSASFSQLRVFRKSEEEDPTVKNDWTRFESDTLEDQTLEITNLCKYVKEILRDAHLNIHFMDKYMNQFKDRVAGSDSSSYSDAILFLRRNLKSLSKSEWDGRNSVLTDENRLAIVEMGKILEDTLELTEYFLMYLRELIYESRHAVHVLYEFCRLCLHCEVPRYDIAASVDRRLLLEQFSKGFKGTKRDRNLPTTEELPLSSEEVLREIQQSPYLQLLEVFPLNANGYFYTIMPDQNA